MDTAKIINYSDVFISCSCEDETGYSHMVRNHLLVYVCSGELVLVGEDTQTIARKGECVFICRNHRTKLLRLSFGEEPFRVIIFIFRRRFLRDFYNKMDKKDIPARAGQQEVNILKIPPRPDTQSLFLSLTPYFNAHIPPSLEIINLKEQEGIFILLKTDNRFYPCLFDFTEPWKIDMIGFLNENYMYDLSLKEISALTGRSLTTFKRDFKKVSGLPPHKWLIQRRFKAAYDKVCEEGKKPGDVYMEVGFKTLPHFYSAFKKKIRFLPGKRSLRK